MDQNNVNSRSVKHLPLSCKIIYIVFAASILLLILSIFVTPVADFFNDRISWIFRTVISLLTAWIPFSLAEFLILILPVAAIGVIAYGNRRFSSSWRDMWIFCGILGAVVAAMLATYILTFGIGYRCSGIDVKLGLNREKVSTEELADTANWLIEKIDENGEEKYKVTDNGAIVASELKSDILSSILDKSLAAALRYLDFKKRGVVIKFDIEKTDDGKYRIDTGFFENGECMFSQMIIVDSLDRAKRMKENFYERPEALYRGVLALLSGNVNYIFN